ncbi:hypothetical protein Q0590_36975 [Rhodocytophaga aerolata]|uniref:Uncharacterized protein n=1 Tax=Rhodocytophaga aerolata TaxID=455078 RepID=A0ABT8RII5_9BACT|nr:hypothetical protein [Rhodocytophaga aerolata]
MAAERKSKGSGSRLPACLLDLYGFMDLTAIGIGNADPICAGYKTGQVLGGGSIRPQIAVGTRAPTH